MYTWKEIWKDRCSTGKVKFTKREGQEALNKMQSNGKTYRENSSLYNCALYVGCTIALRKISTVKKTRNRSH